MVRHGCAHCLEAALFAAVVAAVRCFRQERRWQPVVTAMLVAALAYIGPAAVGATDPFTILAPHDPPARQRTGLPLDEDVEYGFGKPEREEDVIMRQLERYRKAG